jgi:hypothetical protein
MLCDVIYKESTYSSPIIGAGDGPVAFLACCIPNLGFNSLAINLTKI